MKKIITIAVLFMSSFAFSQIKIIETVPVEKLGRVNSNFYIQKRADEYTVFYTTVKSDTDPGTLKTFTFKNIDDAYQNLSDIIVNGFGASPLYDIKLELPYNFVWLHYVLGADKTTVQFMVSNKETLTSSVSEPLTKDQIAKLFQQN